jgi:hypothetical protein
MIQVITEGLTQLLPSIRDITNSFPPLGILL